ncbi:chemotaxis protein CheB [Actinoplanes sp. NPDC026623]|uniref:chemotaxis protein CheB n=1 Tax=Actinoplanes sp. NPDC026623 TaxID=3155610 RepID=UPI0033E2B542
MPIVVLACSAGGLAALTVVLERLPADLPAAVIVLQHLEPDRVSELPAILGQRTTLPVGFAADGDVLTPGRVLVAPSGFHTLIAADLSIALIPSGAAPPYRPSADLLLTTAAIAAGRQLIAVVLTGHGNDAATGATVVHRFGGTVIVSSVATSTQPAMPHATISRGDITGHVVALSDVGDLILTLVNAPMITPTQLLRGNGGAATGDR